MPRPDSPEREFLDLAMKRLAREVEADRHNRITAIDDLKFLNGDQWSPDERKRREAKGRPVLTVNLLPKYVDQVTGDGRHARPQIKVRPVGNFADIQIARIREGIIRDVEYQSNAPAIQDQGLEMMVSCSYGSWRVLTRWSDINPFIQEIYIEAVPNPFLVYMGAGCKDACYADAKYGFILEKVPREEFKIRWPGKAIPGADLVYGEGLEEQNWFDENTVTVAEYFVKTTKSVTMCQMEDGKVMELGEAKRTIDDWEERSKEIIDEVQSSLSKRVAQIPSGMGEMGEADGMSQMGPGGPGSPGGPDGTVSSPMSPNGQSTTPPGIPPMPPPIPLERVLESIGPRPDIAKRREVDYPIIKQYIITAESILNKNGLSGEDFPGEYIPLVLAHGRERNIEGKRHLRSLIRDAKDPQKLVNYWNCLSLDTRLPTPDGWTTMGEVNIGDYLFDERGQPCIVTGVSPIHEDRPCFSVTFSDGNSIVADNLHLWLVEERIKNYTDLYKDRIVNTTELDTTRHFIYNSGPLSLPDIDVPIHPYLLGIWLGDGDSRSGKITVGKDDSIDLIDTIGSFDIEIGGISYDKRNGTGSIRIIGLTRLLSDNRLIGNKHIPKYYLRGSYTQRLQLLQGLMDSDGSIDNKFQCSFSTTIPEILDGMNELLHSLGIKFAVLARSSRTVEFNTYTSIGKPFWQFSFTLPYNKKVFCMGRKDRIQNSKIPQNYELRRTSRRKVVSVVPVPSVPTKCVMVSSQSNLFLAGDGMIPTHNTSAAETVALAPKSPWLGTAKQFEGYEQDYAAANVENFPFLKYNADQQAPGPPIRVGSGEPPVAIFTQLARAEENLKQVVGMFKADVGDTGPERTGAAITQRQMPGDIGTFAFMDNLSRAWAHTGRIINSMIPDVYDTEQDVRLRHLDETESFVPINTTVGNAMKIIKSNPDRYRGMDLSRLQRAMIQSGPEAQFNNVSTGRYGVVVTVGPSYATQRHESAENMLRLVQANPQHMALAMDLIVDKMDFKDSQELSDRFKKVLPPGLVKPKPGDPPSQPKPQEPPTPELMLTQKKVELEAEKIQLASLKTKLAQVKVINEMQDSKEATRKMILGIMEEILSPVHEADSLIQ